MKRILIIEDDPAILMGLKDSLTEEHYEVLTEEDGERGFRKAIKENIDLILLDLMLPSKNGIDICRDLRSAGVNTPILMLTSKKEEMDKVLGLEIGADDYVTKPFSIRELQARIRALLRRKTEMVKEIEEYSFGNVNIDFKKQEAIKNKKALQMSSTEYQILKYLIQHEGEVISRDKFLDDVWGYDAFPTTRTVDNYILSIRKKIEDDPANPKHLLTVYKSGYKFVS
ncbi:MAG: response regulator transcription factor [Melioribacteraceae bacterium]|nr:response regulator transcription factor [Melioribacteraceae bacterium]